MAEAKTNEGFYNRISEAYDLIADAGEHAARERGERALEVQPGETVLEVGYGTGNSLLHFAEQVGEHGVVKGIDVSPGMKQVAEAKLHAKGIAERVELSVGDARSLPYESDTFDAAFLSFTLELFPLEEIPAVLTEIRRVLRPGGRLGVVSMATVEEGEQPSMLERTYLWMHQHFPHIVDCQPIAVEKRIREAGFQMRQSIDLEIFTMPVGVVVATKP